MKVAQDLYIPIYPNIDLLYDIEVIELRDSILRLEGSISVCTVHIYEWDHEFLLVG